MATMDEQANNLVVNLKGLYDKFMTAMQIDKKTGIVYCENKHAKKGKPWRLATMPYIGKYYGSATPKILFIGLDMGIDIKVDENRYLKFEERHKSISKRSLKKCNPHIAGTYAASLAFLSKYNEKWGSEWYDLSHDTYVNKKTTKTLVNNYHKDTDKKIEEEDNVLEYVGLTNLFKFVTVGRDKAQGDSNRRWIDKETELNLLKTEITAFDPDIIILQGSRRYLRKKKNEDEKIFNFFEYCKQNGIIVIKGKHPAYPKDGWNKINGVINLLEMYEKQIKKQR